MYRVALYLAVWSNHYANEFVVFTKPGKSHGSRIPNIDEGAAVCWTRFVRLEANFPWSKEKSVKLRRYTEENDALENFA